MSERNTEQRISFKTINKALEIKSCGMSQKWSQTKDLDPVEKRENWIHPLRDRFSLGSICRCLQGFDPKIFSVYTESGRHGSALTPHTR